MDSLDLEIALNGLYCTVQDLIAALAERLEAIKDSYGT